MHSLMMMSPGQSGSPSGVQPDQAVEELGEQRALIVGSGRVGTALSRVLPQRGITVQAIVSRSPDQNQGRFDVPVVQSVDDAPSEPCLLILAVPDAHIEDTARSIAPSASAGRFICAIHTSGSLPAHALAPLGECGIQMLSFHPIVPFPPLDSDVDPFDGISVSLQGSRPAVDVGRRLASRLHASAIEVTAAQKKELHVAAAIASNFSTTLASVAAGILSAAGVDTSQSRTILATLVQSVAENLRTTDPSDALTGPIVRGDVDIVGQHLETLRKHDPDEVDLYRILGHRTVDLALKSQRLDAEGARRIRSILDADD